MWLANSLWLVFVGPHDCVGIDTWLRWNGGSTSIGSRRDAYGPLTPKDRPTDTFYKAKRMTVGDEMVDSGHLAQAHTDADIYVFFRSHGVQEPMGSFRAGRLSRCRRWKSGVGT